MIRRSFIALGGAAILAACSGVTAYQDRGAANLNVILAASESNWWTQRAVSLDVWTGPKGPNMQYLGTREISAAGSAMGLPTGQPLHLVLVFTQGSNLGSYSSASSIELPMEALSTKEKWQLVVSNTKAGFDYNLSRVR